MSFVNSFVSFGHTVRVITGGADSQYEAGPGTTTYWNGFFTITDASAPSNQGSINNTALGPYTILDVYTTYDDAAFAYQTYLVIYDNGNSVSSGFLHDLKIGSNQYTGLGAGNYANMGGGKHSWVISAPGINGFGTTTIVIN